MIRLCPNLSMLFTDLPFLDRFAAAKAAGFSSVEFQFPYECTPLSIREQLDEHGLSLEMFNLPAGNWSAGDRGLGSIWDRRDEFARGLEQAMTYVDILHPQAVNLLAGISPETDVSDLALLQNTRVAAKSLAEEGVTLLLEPINTIDVPGFALPTAFAAVDVIAEINQPNLKLQLDVYHATIMREDPLEILQEHGELVGHIQIADVPGRHQPGTGEIDWRLFFESLTASEYAGAVGLEYIPEGSTASSFALLTSLGLVN